MPEPAREATQAIARRLLTRRDEGWEREPEEEDVAARYLGRLMWSLLEGFAMPAEEFLDLAEILRRAVEGEGEP